MLNEIMKGVYDGSSKRNKSKLKSRGHISNNNYSIIKKGNTRIKRDINTPSIKSKSNNKTLKESFYSITEINNKKLSTKGNSPKKNENNNSMRINQINPKKFSKRIKSIFREENKSKSKSNKKYITSLNLISREKPKNKTSFVKISNNHKNKNHLISYNKLLKSQDKSTLNPKRRNDNLLISFSFNDKSFHNNITSISIHNKSKSKRKDINKSKDKNDYINNIKKINLNNDSNISNILKANKRSNKKDIGLISNENFNSNRIGIKPKLFSINNNFSYFYNYPLYIIDNEKNIKTQKYSNENDYIKAINSHKEDNKIVQDLLLLEQRDWYDELISISKQLIKKRDTLDKIFNQIIGRYISLYEQFNWIIYSLSSYFKNICGENQNFEKKFFNNKNLHGLSNKFEEWTNGFKWKNLYIRVIPVEKGKPLINEIKALNYYFFEYLQILLTNSSIKKLNYIKKIQLSNNIIFPLIGYTKFYSYILYVSVIIKLENKIYNNAEKIFHASHLTTEELIEQSNKLLIYYSFSFDNSTTSTSNETNVSINENNHTNNNNFDYFNQNKFLYRNNLSKFNKLDLENSLSDEFYIKDLAQSKLFKEINNHNLIKIKEGKYILFNLSRYIPNLFEIKYEYSQKINFFSEINKEEKFFTLYQNYFLNKSMHNIPHKYIKTPEDALDLIYNMKAFSSRLNLKEIFINNLYFKIIYEKTVEIKKDYRKLAFIDHLFTYDISSSSYESSEKNIKQTINNNLKEEKNYIKGKYVILYDLIEPIKLDYSLIKNHKPKYENERIYDAYFLKTNYFSFFISWCEMINKNNFNIKSYSDFKYFMKKYSINSKLLFFSLAYIINDDISDIIMIHLLIKLIYQIFKRDNQNIKKIFLGNIFLYIKNILYPRENGTEKFNIFYSQLGFFISILFLNYKLIDEYIGFGLLSQKNEKNKMNKNIHNKQSKDIISMIQSPKEFLKHLILIARKKPFLFLSEFENKFNVILNPYMKFKSSISLESMEGYLSEYDFSFNKTIVFSYIKPDEISGLIFIILTNNQKELYQKNCIDSGSNEKNKESESYNNIKSFHNYNGIDNINKPKGLYKSKRMSNIKLEDKNFCWTDENLDEFSCDYYPKENMSKIQTTFVNLSSNKKILISPVKDIIQKIQINNISWKDISDKISVCLAPICYKLNYNYETKLIKPNILNKPSFISFLKNEYIINNSDILKLWNESNIFIFQNIKSCSGNTEYSLYKTFIYLFIYYYFIEIDKEKQRSIISKMKSIFSNRFCKFSLNELAIIFLFEGLCCEKGSQESLSKCLALFLLVYGEPRGRNNDSNGIK